MSKSYDIFNGDADGICALQQLRLNDPRAAELVTGVKRDIALVERVDAASGDELTVLDISMKANSEPLRRALERGARVTYFDHHTSGDIPQHPLLDAHIDTAADICTSLIVDRHLRGAHRVWAVVAAFGDNLVASAIRAAEPLGLDHTELARLHELGECLNYNAYGETLEDLHYHPADLYRTISRYREPRHFLYDEPIYGVLKESYADDLFRSSELQPERATAATALYLLPDAAWSRRISGLFANRAAQANPNRAHAVLVGKAGGYNVSVRAPMDRPRGANALCEAFGGGGREGAAGVNLLPQSELDRFADAFERAYS